MGGDSSRALNAVTIAITGALGGQTDLQVASNALAPYASQLIGQTFGHGEDKNTAAQMVSHAILGATLAYVNGGNPAAGGTAAVASEAAANYLAKQYDDGKTAIDPITGQFNPNLLPEEVKSSIRDLTAAIGAVAGGTVGDSAFNAQIAGVVGQNAVENNLLSGVKKDGTISYNLAPETQTFNRYEILVGLGIIKADEVPESVYENTAKLGLKGDPDATADTYKEYLIEQASKENYKVDTQILLSSIPESVGVKGLYADDTLTQSSVAYKFAKYGLSGLSNSELEDLSQLMMQYANYRPALGDTIQVENVKNQGMIFALLQAGINEGKIDTNIKSTDVERQKVLNDLYFGYERLFVSDDTVQFQRDGISRLNVAATSALGVVATGLCDASGGSHHSCTGAGEVGAAFGGAFGSAFVQKVVPSLAVGKNEPVIQIVDAVNSKSNVNTYPLLPNPKTVVDNQVHFNPQGSQLRGSDGTFVNTFPLELPDPTNLKRGELRQMSDGRWKIYGVGEPRTAKGNYNFIIQDGKVYVGLGNSEQGHIEISRANPVGYAGQVSFGSGKNTKGILNEWNNGSGHYKPEPRKVEWENSIKLPLDKFKELPHD